MVNETHHKGLEFIQEIIHVKARLEEEFASIWPHFLSGFKSTRTALQAFEMLAEEHKATLARKKELERENQHLKVKLKILIPKEVGILHEENEALRNEVKNLWVLYNASSLLSPPLPSSPSHHFTLLIDCLSVREARTVSRSTLKSWRCQRGGASRRWKSERRS